MTRILRVLCAAALASGSPARAAPPPVEDAALSAGIALAREGDFQGALLKLDEAVRRLETAEAPPRDLAQGYLDLGISYLELGQEMPALERFRAAVLRDPGLRLDPAEFSPQVIRFFEAARQEVAAMRAPSASAPPAPAPPAQPAASGKGNGSGRTVLLVVGGAVAVAAVALALGDGDADTTTTTLRPPASVASPASWTSRLEAPGARGQVLADGAVAGEGAHAGAAVTTAGRHRLEGVLVAGRSRPGLWRFEVQGIRAGSLRVLAGKAVTVTSGAVVFRLEGRAGERVALGFETP
jgi:hypothetical protein